MSATSTSAHGNKLIYRQPQIVALQGLPLDRSTLVGLGLHSPVALCTPGVWS